MSEQITPERYQQVLNFDANQRLKYLLKSLANEKQLWLLVDDIGCVMLNTDDEDCVPIWPSEEFALGWATGDWQHCKAQSVTLKEWQQRWIPGLIEDELSLAVFPNEKEEGVVMFADEFDFEFNKQDRSK